MVFSAVTKARKKAQNEAPQQSEQEAWPSWDTTIGPEREQTSQPSYESLETIPESEFELPDYTSPTHTSQQSQSVDQLTSMQPRKAAPALQSSMSQQQEVSPIEAQPSGVVNGDITEDFDLRKAVLWSEILKPKFKE